MGKITKTRTLSKSFDFSSWVKWIVIGIIILALPFIVYVALHPTILSQHADTAQGPANDLKLTNQSRDQYVAAQNLISQLNTDCSWSAKQQIPYTVEGAVSAIQVKPSFVPNPSGCEQVANQIYTWLYSNGTGDAAAQQLLIVRNNLKSLMGSINSSLYPVNILYANVYNLGYAALNIKELVGKYSATYPCMLPGAILGAGGAIICPTIPPTSVNTLLSDLISYNDSLNGLLAMANSDYNLGLYNTLALNISLITSSTPTPTPPIRGIIGYCPGTHTSYNCRYNDSDGNTDGGIVKTTYYQNHGKVEYCSKLCIIKYAPSCQNQHDVCSSAGTCRANGGTVVNLPGCSGRTPLCCGH